MRVSIPDQSAIIATILEFSGPGLFLWITKGIDDIKMVAVLDLWALTGPDGEMVADLVSNTEAVLFLDQILVSWWQLWFLAFCSHSQHLCLPTPGPLQFHFSQ